VINPIAPELTLFTTSVNGPVTSPLTPPPNQLDGVSLQWNSVVHNATYYLYKMNSTGNWQKIYQIKSNQDPLTVNLITDLQINSLQKIDADGNTIYHRFKVGVENSSGLLNLTDNELTV
jgi:hypothetical protein